MVKEALADLGKIEKVDIREAWKTESRHFTPWLEKEIDILNETLGVEIDIIERETKIGDFNADLFGRELNLKANVIIENQFGKTDHDHLGKLLTYSAGKDAGIIIWIAEEFRDKHRSVLDWMNESSGEDRSFFGVEIEVIKIEESKLAPNLKVVSKPNEWDKTISLEEKETTAREEQYREFWDDLFEMIREEIPNFTSARKAQPQSWMSVGAGKSGLYYVIAFKKDREFEVGLHIDRDEASENKMYFNKLKGDKEEIEESISGDLLWDEGEDVRRSRTSVFYSDISIDDSNDKLDDVKHWAIERAKEFKNAFDDRIKGLE